MPTQTQKEDHVITIGLVGGGTSGHITPLLAVAEELKKQQPGCKVVYIGEKNGKFFEVASKSPYFDETYVVSAGKFRRYHSQSKFSQLFDIQTMWLNFKDLGKFLVGIHESKRLLKRLRPDVVFIKGGFVGVPVGKACARLKIPYITHDSDTLPGLANRMIAKHAFLHTVGMPKEFYSYPAEKTEVVGVPLVAEYKRVTKELMRQYRNNLGIPKDAEVVFVTGGSNGAERINLYMQAIAADLLDKNPKLFILHQTGKTGQGIYASLTSAQKSRVITEEYMAKMYMYSGAADVVVSRAGATTLAELAVQAKATILIPNPFLTGGHQLTNAKRFADAGAVKVLHEETLNTDPGALRIAVQALLRDSAARESLGEQLSNVMGHPDSARELATIILESHAYILEQQLKGKK